MSGVKACDVFRCICFSDRSPTLLNLDLCPLREVHCECSRKNNSSQRVLCYVMYFMKSCKLTFFFYSSLLRLHDSVRGGSVVGGPVRNVFELSKGASFFVHLVQMKCSLQRYSDGLEVKTI